MTQQKTCTTFELCQRYGITRKTLFYYDRKGLLKPVERIGSQGIKLYDEASVKRLETILEYRSAGLMIEEIQALLGEGCEDRLTVLNAALSRLKNERAEKDAQITALIRIIERYAGE